MRVAFWGVFSAISKGEVRRHLTLIVLYLPEEPPPVEVPPVPPGPMPLPVLEVLPVPLVGLFTVLLLPVPIEPLVLGELVPLVPSVPGVVLL